MKLFALVVLMGAVLAADAMAQQQPQPDPVSPQKYVEVLRRDREAAQERAAYWEARAQFLAEELAKAKAPEQK